MVSLLLAALSALETGEVAVRLKTVTEGLFEAFAADTEDSPRAIRVGAALGALAVMSLATRGRAVRRDPRALIAASYDTLGHRRPGPGEDL